MNPSKLKAIETPGTNLTRNARNSDLVNGPWVHLGRRRDVEAVWGVLERVSRREPAVTAESAHARRSVLEAMVRETVAPGYLPSRGTRCAAPIESMEIVTLGRVPDLQTAVRIAESVRSAGSGTQSILYVDIGLLEHRAGEILSALSDFLGEGGIRLLVSATPRDYTALIASSDRLSRLFEAVTLDPYTVQETAFFLRRLQDRLQTHHRFEVDHEVLEAAAATAHARVPASELPEAAADLLEAAVTWLKLRRHETLAVDDRRIDAEIRRLEAENEEAIGRSDFTRAGLAREEADRLRRRRSDLARAISADDDDRSIDVPLFRQACRHLHGNAFSLFEDAARTIANWEAELRRRVRGRERAVERVGDALRARAAGLCPEHRPIACFLFAGLPGTGKSALAEALADVTAPGGSGAARIELAEYQDRESAARFTEVLDRIFSGRAPEVLLLERVDRAHPEVLDRLLARIDPPSRLGSATSDTVVVMTVTVGEEVVPARPSFGFGVAEAPFDEWAAVEKLGQAFERLARPDFWKRAEVVAFGPLSDAVLEEILDQRLAELGARLKVRGLEARLSDSARKFLLRDGRDPAQGARPLLRAMERRLVRPLADRILRGDFLGRSVVAIDLDLEGARLIFEGVPVAGA